MGGPTPKKEIERQHADAVSLVEGNLPCADESAIENGEIPLTLKTVPTIDNPLFNSQGKSINAQENNSDEEKKESHDGATDKPVYLSSRGTVSATALADLVTEGYNDALPPIPSKFKTPEQLYAHYKSQPVASATNLWDPANAARNNVHIIRPSHDAWGIKKIALIFCDDFLQDVYEMPWCHDSPQMQHAIQPIFDALNINRDRVVRCLFAALPPGVTIPTHHDTGEWVRHTHRIHIPVIVTDPDQILFRCGPTEADMERISCHPGHIFEINNQGKHAVSNCSTEHRIHMILDYVDPEFVIKRRIQLAPGERLLQTRRSIDRAADYGKRPTPSFMILGAQKAGTTSLYDYLSQHPLIVKARRRETHCLDWRWDEKATTTKQRQEHCLKFFYTDELQRHPSLQSGDSTPSYLLDSARVIPRIKEVFDHDIKFMVMTRDPVKRAKSHFEMVTSNDGTAAQLKTRGKEWRSLSFEEVIDLDIKNMKDCGLIPYWNAITKEVDLRCFYEYVGSGEEDAAWEKYLKKHVLMNTGSHSLLSRGMYELQLRSWYQAFPKASILVLKLEDMSSGGVQGVVDRALSHLELPQYKVRDEGAKNTREYEPMKQDTEDMLRRFYAPHNERMKALLGDEWTDPWSYE
mmetsp:Transcript_13970/g.30358  ORF Transcript_13970/g.30358 Transcript_13970/m.30358 type:complete len:634 (+) Transcript_13970:594-2495(+)